MQNENFRNEKVEFQSYHRIATRGAFWNVGFAIANKVVTLVGQVVLAWLLSPSDMGLAGMAIAMAGFAAFMGAGSVGDVLIQRRKYRSEAGQGLWLSFGLSLLTSMFIALLIPVAIGMGHANLKNMLLILALFPLADAFTPVLSAELKTNLDFKYFAVSSFVSGVVYTGCTLLLAFEGFGPYSLIIPVIPRSLAMWGCMLLRTGWPIFQKPDFTAIKKMIRPSLSLSMTGFLGGLQTQAPVFCVGLVVDSSGLGHFSWGWMVASQAVFLLAVNLRQVLMPIFTKMEHNSERQLAATFRAMRAITAFLFLVCGLQALLAGSLLDRFFPEKWHASGPVITWISMGLVFQGIYVCVSSWLNAVGKYKELLVVTTMPVIFGAGLAYLGAVNSGVEGAAWGSAAGIALASLISFFFISWSRVKGKIRLILPIAVSFLAWVVSYFFISTDSFLSETLSGMFFLIVTSLAWWYWDDGAFKTILKR